MDDGAAEQAHPALVRTAYLLRPRQWIAQLHLNFEANQIIGRIEPFCGQWSMRVLWQVMARADHFKKNFPLLIV